MDFKWWISLFFFICLYLGGLYEIAVKEGKKNKLSNSHILIEILLIWILPLLLGYGLNNLY